MVRVLLDFSWGWTLGLASSAVVVLRFLSGEFQLDGSRLCGLRKHVFCLEWLINPAVASNIYQRSADLLTRPSIGATQIGVLPGTKCSLWCRTAVETHSDPRRSIQRVWLTRDWQASLATGLQLLVGYRRGATYDDASTSIHLSNCFIV